MFQNYLKIALRNLLKFKGYAAVNIFGLAIGVACCLLIVQHLRDELRYDVHHENLDRLYRVNSTFTAEGNSTNMASSPSPLAKELATNYPEVEAAARIFQSPSTAEFLVKYEDKTFYEEGGFWADSTFFEVLTYAFIEGDPSTALDQPNQVVISKNMSTKIFGDEKAVGRTIFIGDQTGDVDYQITGVFDSEKYRSHIDANFFVNIRSGGMGYYFADLQEWAGNNLFNTYIRLAPGADAVGLEAKFPALVEDKAGAKLKEMGFSKAHFLEKVSDIYLYSEAEGMVPGKLGDMTFVYIFGIIAIFILLIACINFMNLSTAKATLRAQEVGVRKVVGATRGMVSKQFLTEAFVYAGIAVVLAYVLAELALPIFNQIAEKDLSFQFGKDPALVVWLLGILIGTGLLAGSYPALYLSSFSPAHIFRGQLGDRFSARRVRMALVVVQFVVSIALIQGILVIQEQLDFMRQKKLGFNTEAKLVLPLNTPETYQNFSLLKTELLQSPQVKGVSASTFVPGAMNVDDMFVRGEGQSNEQNSYIHMYWTDVDYLPNMGFELAAGRFFDENRKTDTIHASVINETLVPQLGYTMDNVLGKKFFWSWNGQEHEHEIIGVVRDFHSTSLRDEMDSHAFFWEINSDFRYAVVNLGTDDLATTIAELENAWKKVNPEQPFDHFFVDEKIQEAYQDDRRMARLIVGFTLLAIFISCLGLFGLAAFAAESRTKEIGVRKVLGATTGNIVGLLSKEFLILVVISLAIATPIAFYFMDGWLQDFHYRINMPWWTFGVAGVLAIIVAFATVSFQSVKAAVANPVESLRSE